MKMKYKCALCGAEYELNGMVNHIQRTHKIKYKDYYEQYIEPGPHLCRFCGKEAQFKSYTGFKTYCLACAIKQQQETRKNNFVPKEKSRRTDCEFECAICHEQYKNHAMLNRHIIKIHKEITTEEYYLKYMDGEVKYCEICGNRSKWLGTHYHNICGSVECSHAIRSKNNAMNNPIYRKKISDVQKNFSDEKKQEIKNKKEQTYLEKYGYRHNWQNSECREKCLETCIKKYGTSNGFLMPGAKQTIKEKYGVEHFSQSSDFAKKRKKKYVLGNLSFDSKDEIYFYNFVKVCGFNVVVQPDVKLTYLYEGKEHTYQPDFLINENLYEIKGTHFFENKDPDKNMVNPFDHSMDELYEAKHQCMIHNGVEIVTDVSLFSLLKLFFNIDINENIMLETCFVKDFPGTNKWPANHPIWDCFVPGHKDPRSAWHDKVLLEKAIKNLVKTVNDCLIAGKEFTFCRRMIMSLVDGSYPVNVLNRFTIAKIAPKVTALRENDLLKIIEECGLSLDSGVYCPMAGFGGIVRAARRYAEEHGQTPNIEAYDINENFCRWYGWTCRDVLAQIVHTDKTVVVCPPFGKKYEHWKGTPDNMSDIDFIDWVKLIKEHVIAPNYIFIGPEFNDDSDRCGLFKKKLGIALYEDK